MSGKLGNVATGDVLKCLVLCQVRRFLPVELAVRTRSDDAPDADSSSGTAKTCAAAHSMPPSASCSSPPSSQVEHGHVRQIRQAKGRANSWQRNSKHQFSGPWVPSEAKDSLSSESSLAMFAPARTLFLTITHSLRFALYNALYTTACVFSVMHGMANHPSVMQRFAPCTTAFSAIVCLDTGQLHRCRACQLPHSPGAVQGQYAGTQAVRSESKRMSAS